MKTLKIFTQIILVLYTINIQAQQNGVNFKYDVLDPNHAGKIFRNTVQKAAKPEGSPYSKETFTLAKVSNVEQKAFMRYNVYTDEFEFLNAKKDTLILDKLDDFSLISIENSTTKYQLSNYTNSKNKQFYGYLIPFYEKNHFTLYKKENVNFYEGKVAKTTLERNMPAKYVKSTNTYFFKNKDEIITEFPSSKKALLKLYPSNKDSLDVFIKENKIDFNDETDLKKILDFISAF